MEARADQINPLFDSDLADRLPFNVGYRDLTTNQVQNLYQEYTYYRALKALEPIRIPVAKAAVQEGGQPVSSCFGSSRAISISRFPGV